MAKLIEASSHVRGASRFIEDISLPQHTLYAACLFSQEVGTIVDLNLEPALAMEGVVSVLSAADIPGRNQIGGIFADEPLLAGAETHYIGQPMALILATTRELAYRARALLNPTIEPGRVITTAQEADQLGEYLFPERTMQKGDVDAHWGQCDLVVEGTTHSGFQEHVYLETQASLAMPEERGRIRILASTQGPTAVQRMTARVLGLPMHHVEVDVLRLGGGFGGKEDQATPWAVLAALGAHATGHPVKLALERHDDLMATGKRHPYSSSYKLGLKKDGTILAFDVTYLQNGGACADLSPAILERTVCHATGSYEIPNVRILARGCKTNLPPNTAFRGFGGPQAHFVIEAAIAHAARKLNLHTSQIQAKNLLEEGDRLPFGQVLEACHAKACWAEVQSRYNLEQALAKRDAFNKDHKLKKKGVAMMPVCFGISFNKTSMNQAGALVHIYQDGSVGVSTAAVEMGQGVNTKLCHIAATVLGISMERVHVESTNTTRVANTSPTAASSAADLNGKAVERACIMLRSRLLTHLAAKKNMLFKHLDLAKDQVYSEGKPLQYSWNRLIRSAFEARVDLSEHGYYATPEIYWNKEENQGKPFAYHTYGTAMICAEVDILRGTYHIDSVQIVHDFGKSLNRDIDLGQVEGGLAQGIGWMTLEEISYDERGRLLAANLSSYKLPDLGACPKKVDTHFLETDGNEKAVFKSKAIGEPPLLYGIGAYFALLDAIRAFKDIPLDHIQAPMTPEQLFNYCHKNEP